jgi:Recombinase zinc beta ribbon domain
MLPLGNERDLPMTHYLLSGLVECGECGTSFSSYRPYVGKQLVTGERRIYHRAAYKCNSGTSGKMHARENITPCRNPQVATHLLEDAVFEIIQELMRNPVKLRGCMEALKESAMRDHEKVVQSLMAVARKIQAAEERKRQTD